MFSSHRGNQVRGLFRHQQRKSQRSVPYESFQMERRVWKQWKLESKLGLKLGLGLRKGKKSVGFVGKKRGLSSLQFLHSLRRRKGGERRYLYLQEVVGEPWLESFFFIPLSMDSSMNLRFI